LLLKFEVVIVVVLEQHIGKLVVLTEGAYKVQIVFYSLSLDGCYAVELLWQDVLLKGL
jgi:hypothetical protein